MKSRLYTHFEQTIIDNIDFESYNIDNEGSLYDKIIIIYNIFNIEHVHKNNKHVGDEKLFSAWVQGLPNVLSVPFYYSDIIENALSYAKENDDKLLQKRVENEEQFCIDYWDNLSNAFFVLKENL